MTNDFYCEQVLSGKTKVRKVFETENALLLELLSVVKKVAADIVLECGACRVITNLGDYQDSKHLHWHLVFGTNR